MAGKRKTVNPNTRNYTNPNNKKYTPYKSAKDIHTVVPFTSYINDTGDASYDRFADVREGTADVTTEFIKQFTTHESLRQFDYIITSMERNYSALSVNQKKAITRLKRGIVTIEDYRADIDSQNTMKLVRLKLAMQEVLAGLDSISRSGFIKGSEPMIRDRFQEVAEYGYAIFGSGRRFSHELSGAREVWQAHANQVNALRGAYRAFESKIDYAELASQDIDATLVAVVCATLHVSVSEAVKAIAEYNATHAPWEGGEIPFEQFKQWSETAQIGPREQEKARKIEEDRRKKAEERARREAEFNIALAMQDIANAYTEIYTEEFDDSYLHDKDEDELLDDYFEDSTLKEKVLGLIHNPDAWNKVTSAVGTISETILDPLKEIAKSISKLNLSSAQMIDFSDLLSLPLQSLLSLLNTAVNGISVAFTAVSASIGVVSGIVSKVAGLASGDGDDEEEEYDKRRKRRNSKHPNAMAIGKTILSIIGVVFKAFALGFTVISSVIKIGFSMFTDVLSSMMKMFKEIAETSEVMKAISNILNLAISMFFLPFFNAFGNVLLDIVFQIITFARDSGLNFADMFGEYFNMMAKTVATYFEEHKEELKTLAEEVFKVVYEMFSTLLPDLIMFITYFTKTFLENSETMFDMLEKGIEVGEIFLENNLLTMLLNYGIKIMDFINTHAILVMDMFSLTNAIVKMCLNAFSSIMEHMLLFCIALGGALGSLFGMAGFVGLSTRVVSKMISFGLSKTAGQLLRKGLAKHALRGGLIGTAIGYVFYEMFFKFGEGGYIPATPGGLLSIVAEKETEYIIPESKVHLIRGHNNLVINFNDDVYLLDNPEQFIKDVVTEESGKSHYR